MLDKAFTPPDVDVSARETARRQSLLNEFVPLIAPGITGLMLSGSMAYGQNYSVADKSDVDMQLMVNQDSVIRLKESGLFDETQLGSVLTAYASGLIKQFSLTCERSGVSMECHFWDERAYVDAVTFVVPSVPRLRSSMSPSKDYGYSFDGSESVVEFTGEVIDGIIVSDFPAFREVDGKLFLCRPITNVLGCTRIILGEERLQSILDTTWRMAAERLMATGRDGIIDLTKNNFFNCLPGKNKVSPASKQQIDERTKMELERLGAKYAI